MVEIFRKNCFLWLFVSVLTLFMFLAAPAFAQSLGSINISSSPKYPGPNEEVLVSLTQYGVNTFGATIKWYVNDAEQTEYRNEREMKFTTGGIGESSMVEVVVSQEGSVPLSSSRVFVPILVDIILESETYVPYFYKGRALPSSEANIRAIAVVHDNTTSPDFTYTYKWMLESSSLFGGPIKGKHVAELNVPMFGQKYLSVEVSDSDGNVLGENYVLIQSHSPELRFYEENPLRGLSEKEIAGTLNLLGEETTIFGEPYYMRLSPENSGIEFEWGINGREASSNINESNAVTLQRTGDSGSARIGLDIFIRDGIPQFTKGYFNILFR